MEEVVPAWGMEEGLFQQHVEALKHQINTANTDRAVQAPYSLYLYALNSLGPETQARISLPGIPAALLPSCARGPAGLSPSSLPAGPGGCLIIHSLN